MSNVESEIDRWLELLRMKIRERGYTQLQVQVRYDWGKSYLSQLLTKQKRLRVEDVYLILSAIQVEPQQFFAELYPTPVLVSYAEVKELEESLGWEDSEELSPLRPVVAGLAWSLIDKDVVTKEEILDGARRLTPNSGRSWPTWPFTSSCTHPKESR